MMTAKENTYGKKKARDHAGFSPSPNFVVQRAAHPEYVGLYGLSQFKEFQVSQDVGGKDNNDMRPQISGHRHP